MDYRAAGVRDVTQNGRQDGAILDFIKKANLSGQENSEIANIFC